jgi:hypothetical protein
MSVSKLINVINKYILVGDCINYEVSQFNDSRAVNRCMHRMARSIDALVNRPVPSLIEHHGKRTPNMAYIYITFNIIGSLRHVTNMYIFGVGFGLIDTCMIDCIYMYTQTATCIPLQVPPLV